MEVRKGYATLAPRCPLSDSKPKKVAATAEHKEHAVLTVDKPKYSNKVSTTSNCFDSSPKSFDFSLSSQRDPE